MNHLQGFAIFVNAWFGTDIHVRCPIDIVIEDSDTSLLLFLKGHIDKPVNSDRILLH